MEDITLLVDVTNTDILHGAAGIIATPKLRGDIDCSSSYLHKCYY